MVCQDGLAAAADRHVPPSWSCRVCGRLCAEGRSAVLLDGSGPRDWCHNTERCLVIFGLVALPDRGLIGVGLLLAVFTAICGAGWGLGRTASRLVSREQRVQS